MTDLKKVKSELFERMKKLANSMETNGWVEESTLLDELIKKIQEGNKNG